MEPRANLVYSVIVAAREAVAQPQGNGRSWDESPAALENIVQLMNGLDPGWL